MHDTADRLPTAVAEVVACPSLNDIPHHDNDSAAADSSYGRNTTVGGTLSRMTGRKRSVSLDDATLETLARRAGEEGLDQAAYLAQLIHQDDLQRRLVVDSAALAHKLFGTPPCVRAEKEQA